MPQYISVLNELWNEEQKKRKQFYKEMDESRKMEFIEGEIIVHSPAKDIHIMVQQNLSTIISTFSIINNLGKVRGEKALVRLTRNDFEPDLSYFNKIASKKINEDTLFYPSPDFVIEILSKSTEKKDRGVKFNDYELHNVKEYWIIDTNKKIVEQYILQKGKYELMVKIKTGSIECSILKGLNIP
ncbi:MAG: Uma2 family endonuclease, partial [Ferruginibacter sp.]